MEKNKNKNSLPNNSFIYFIGNLDIGEVKIGRSIHPHKRLKELQTASPHPLFILKMIPGNSFQETKYHSHFSKSKLKGEWYSITPDIKEFLDRI